MTEQNNCPCGSQKAYMNCCGAFIEGQAVPATPEELMRSRYTAYTECNVDYIAKTMRGKAAKGFSEEGTLHWAKRVHWLGLQVLDSSVENNKGFVEFIADYEIDKQKKSMHELSEFQRIDGVWYYVDGEHKTIGQPKSKTAKIGRNDLCPCGSTKKYKKCCGA